MRVEASSLPSREEQETSVFSASFFFFGSKRESGGDLPVPSVAFPSVEERAWEWRDPEVLPLLRLEPLGQARCLDESRADFGLRR